MFYDHNECVAPIAIDHPMTDGEILPIAGGIEIIHVPGHCAGDGRRRGMRAARCPASATSRHAKMSAKSILEKNSTKTDTGDFCSCIAATLHNEYYTTSRDHTVKRGRETESLLYSPAPTCKPPAVWCHLPGRQQKGLPAYTNILDYCARLGMHRYIAFGLGSRRSRYVEAQLWATSNAMARSRLAPLLKFVSLPSPTTSSAVSTSSPRRPRGNQGMQKQPHTHSRADKAICRQIQCPVPHPRIGLINGTLTPSSMCRDVRCRHPMFSRWSAAYFTPTLLWQRHVTRRNRRRTSGMNSESDRFSRVNLR